MLALLRGRNVGTRYGGIVALDGISFGATAYEAGGPIGPNGAGNTAM